MSKDTQAAANPFGDLNSLLGQFTIPGVDMSTFIDARRKNVQALADANKAAYEAMQALAQTQTQMLTHAMQGVQQSAQDLSTGKVAATDTARQSELARDAWQKMLADMTQLAEMAQKSQVDALASLSLRTKENMDEMKKALHHK